MRMVFYPLKEVTLRGICDAFIVRDYSKMKSGIKILSAEVFARSRKSIITSGTLILKTDAVSASLIKELTELNTTMLLGGDALLTLLSNATFSGGLAVDASIDADAFTSVSNIVVELALGGEICSSYIVLDLGEILPTLILRGSVKTDQYVGAEPDPSGVSIFASVSPTLNVPSILNESGLSISGSIAGTVKRLRTLGDLVGITLSDMQDWNLGTYFYLGV